MRRSIAARCVVSELLDDTQITLGLWEVMARTGVVVVGQRPLCLSEADHALLAGSSSRFATLGEWKRDAGGLRRFKPPIKRSRKDRAGLRREVGYPERFLLEEAGFARDALPSLGEYAIHLRDPGKAVPVVAALIMVVEAGSYDLIAEAVSPGADAMMDWEIHRLLWPNFGQDTMPGVALLRVTTPAGLFRIVVPDGKRSADMLTLAAASVSGVVLVADSRDIRRAFARPADASGLMKALETSSHAGLPVDTAKTVPFRDEFRRWQDEMNLPLQTWLDRNYPA